MLRYILFDTTLFGDGAPKELAETNIMWTLEALCQRDQVYLKANPSTPRLYESGVHWSAPQQLAGDVDEVKLLKRYLGRAASVGEVRRALEKVQDVLGGEIFRDIGRVIEKGDGDCDNLACWRVAELRQMGIQARPFMTSRERPEGGTTYHALVIWPPLGPCNYETSEDPSLLLGMYQPQRKADRDEEIRKNAERSDIIRKYGRAALRPAHGPATPFDGAALDAAVSELLGTRRRAA